MSWFGVEGLKVHSKLTHISSPKGDIACISTGNFHEGNAKLYTDTTLFTADRRITREVDAVFDFIRHRTVRSFSGNCSSLRRACVPGWMK